MIVNIHRILNWQIKKDILNLGFSNAPKNPVQFALLRHIHAEAGTSSLEIPFNLLGLEKELSICLNEELPN